MIESKESKQDIGASYHPLSEPYAKGISPSASAFGSKTFKPQAVKLSNALNRLGLLTTLEYRVDRSENQTPYWVDVAAFPKGLPWIIGCEAMGAGSSSDDPIRDEFLCKHGIVPLYFENHDIDHHMGRVIAKVESTILLLKAVRT